MCSGAQALLGAKTGYNVWLLASGGSFCRAALMQKLPCATGRPRCGVFSV
jgi:hypothetical protein